MKISDIVGWVGMILALLAYYLVSHKKVESDSKTYQFMNLFAVIFMGVNVWVQKAYPIFVLEVIWGLLSIKFLIKIYKKEEKYHE